MYSTHTHTMAMHWPASGTAPFLNVHTKAQATVLACWLELEMDERKNN